FASANGRVTRPLDTVRSRVRHATRPGTAVQRARRCSGHGSAARRGGAPIEDRQDHADEHPRQQQDRYAAGLPDHHDPTAGIGGAAPAYSALTLRLVLSLVGFVTFAASAIWLSVAGAPTPVVVALVAVAVLALVNTVVVVRRKRRGEPG